MLIITVRHAAQSLKKSDEDGQGQTAVAGNVENEKHEQEDERRLTDEDSELIDQMSQHDFSHLNTCETVNLHFCLLRFTENKREKKPTGHNAAVEKTRLSLVDENGSRQGDGNEIDNSKNDN